MCQHLNKVQIQKQTTIQKGRQTFSFVWLIMTLHAVYDYVWLCMTAYDYVWLCMTMYEHIWIRKLGVKIVTSSKCITAQPKENRPIQLFYYSLYDAFLLERLTLENLLCMQVAKEDKLCLTFLISQTLSLCTDLPVQRSQLRYCKW